MAAAVPPTHDLRIGDWIVRPGLAQIERGVETVHVTPRAMAVLLYLAERPGQSVSRNEILDALWPRMDVTPDVLTRCIVELRKAFRDDPKQPTVIGTIPKVGIRLVAPVRFCETGSGGAAEPLQRAVSTSTGSTGSAAPSTRASLRRLGWPWIAAGMMLILALGLGARLLWLEKDSELPRMPEIRSSHTQPSLAVLPFSSESADGENVAFLANGIHDELLSRLSRIRNLKVISRRSSMDYRDTLKRPHQIGQELDVATILYGRVQHASDQLRISVQLVDVDSDEILWSDTYAVAMANDQLFATQAQIAVSIANALSNTLTPDELARVHQVPTQSARARDFYLSGNDHTGSTNRLEALPAAIELYGRATTEDPRFALAWARLGSAHVEMYWYGLDRTRARLDMADAAIRRALELEPDLPEAHTAMATYYDKGFGDHGGALAEFAKAELLLPEDPDASYLRASLYRRLGAWELALNDFQRALELDPRNVVYLRQQHVTYLFMRDYYRAEQSLKRILLLAPDDGTTLVDQVVLDLCRSGDTTRARAYENAGGSYATGLAQTYTAWLAAIYDRDYKRALRVLDAARGEQVFDGDLRPSYIPKAALYARTYRLAEDHDRARMGFQQIVEHLPEELQRSNEEDVATTSSALLVLAEAQAGLGQTQHALRTLRRALGQAPASTDRILGSALQIASVVRVLLPAGEHARALETLDDYLSGPGIWTIEGLTSDPRFDQIREDAGFRALLAKHRGRSH